MGTRLDSSGQELELRDTKVQLLRLSLAKLGRGALCLEVLSRSERTVFGY